MTTNENAPAPDAVERAKRLWTTWKECYPYITEYERAVNWTEAPVGIRSAWVGVEMRTRDIYEAPMRARIAELTTNYDASLREHEQEIRSARSAADHWKGEAGRLLVYVEDCEKLKARIAELEAQLAELSSYMNENHGLYVEEGQPVRSALRVLRLLKSECIRLPVANGNPVVETLDNAAKQVANWPAWMRDPSVRSQSPEQGLDVTAEHVSPAVRVEERKRVPKVGDEVDAYSFMRDEWFWKIPIVSMGKDGHSFKVDAGGWSAWFDFGSEGKTWRWPATQGQLREFDASAPVETKPINAVGDGKAAHEPSKDEWEEFWLAAHHWSNCDGGAPAELTLALVKSIKCLIARAASAERARCAEEIAKLRASNAEMARQNIVLRRECEGLRDELEKERNEGEKFRARWVEMTNFVELVNAGKERAK